MTSIVKEIEELRVNIMGHLFPFDHWGHMDNQVEDKYECNNGADSPQSPIPHGHGLQ
jgi:hypothetical protein